MKVHPAMFMKTKEHENGKWLDREECARELPLAMSISRYVVENTGYCVGSLAMLLKIRRLFGLGGDLAVRGPLRP
jgi:hypothetical protein